jgi:hypothetical protein
VAESRHQECLTDRLANTIAGVLGAVRKVTVIVGVIAVRLVAPLGWQVVSSEIANSELQEDLRDLASQNAARLALSPANTDEDFRNAIVPKAREHGIQLKPDQITAQRGERRTHQL